MVLEQLNGTISAYGVEISTITVAFAVGVFLLGYFANKFSNLMVERAVKRRGGDPHASVTGKKLTAYIIYPLTFVAVLGVFGFPPSALAGAVG